MSWKTIPCMHTHTCACTPQHTIHCKQLIRKWTISAPFHTLSPTSGTISSKTSGTLLLSLPSKANSRHFSSQNISAMPISLYSVCVCVCVCVRARIFCINVLYCKAFRALSTLCVSFFFFLFSYIFLIADKKSISMYIICVILCLFSTLSRRVGALQISIIIKTALFRMFYCQHTNT